MLLLLGLCHPGALSAQEEGAPLKRIGIRCGGQEAEFALKERMNGMLYWTYDCFEQPSLHHAAKDWALFVRKMGNFEKSTGKEPIPR